MWQTLVDYLTNKVVDLLEWWDGIGDIFNDDD